jgi:hypothetical protein
MNQIHSGGHSLAKLEFLSSGFFVSMGSDEEKKMKMAVKLDKRLRLRCWFSDLVLWYLDFFVWNYFS